MIYVQYVYTYIKLYTAKLKHLRRKDSHKTFSIIAVYNFITGVHKIVPGLIVDVEELLHMFLDIVKSFVMPFWPYEPLG